MSDHPHLVSEDPPVYKNKLGITDAGQLGQVERGLSDLRTFQLRENPVQGNFDFDHLKAIHTRLVGDLYSWAGQPRDFQTQRAHSIFARPDYIEPEGARIFARLHKDNLLRGVDQEVFVDKMARLGSDLNALHPFIDANGRSARLMMEQVGAQAGRPLDFSRFTQDEIYRAFEGSFHGGHEQLVPLVRRALEAGRVLHQARAAAPERAILEPVPEAGTPLAPAASSYLRDRADEALAKHPQLAGAYGAEKAMRTASIDNGPLAAGVAEAVNVRIREHVAVFVHRGLDPTPSPGVLNAVRHDAAVTQLDHAVREAQSRPFNPQSSVTYKPGHGISLEQRDWLIRSADDALLADRPRQDGLRAPATQSEARWIASAIGLTDFPTPGQRPFRDPELTRVYEGQQRSLAEALEQNPKNPTLTIQREREMNV